MGKHIVDHRQIATQQNNGTTAGHTGHVGLAHAHVVYAARQAREEPGSLITRAAIDAELHVVAEGLNINFAIRTGTGTRVGTGDIGNIDLIGRHQINGAAIRHTVAVGVAHGYVVGTRIEVDEGCGIEEGLATVDAVLEIVTRGVEGDRTIGRSAVGRIGFAHIVDNRRYGLREGDGAALGDAGAAHETDANGVIARRQTAK